MIIDAGQYLVISIEMDNASEILSRLEERDSIATRSVPAVPSETSSLRNEEPKDSSVTNEVHDLFKRSVSLRERVSLADHLHRLYFLLTWSDRNGGRWMGIKRFLDCYFSLIFHPYFGERFKMTVLHIAKRSKMCCHFQLGVASDYSSYTLLIMLNYPLWDKLLQISTGLPNRYFRRSIRSMLRSSSSNVEETTLPDENNFDPTGLETTNFTYLMNVSLAALCLVDRLEFSMQPDLDRCGASHVVTVSRFFSNAHDAKNLFNTIALVE